MPYELFEDMKRYVGFSAEDAATLAALGPMLRGKLPEVVDEFYRQLMQHPRARAVLTEGEAQLTRLRGTLEAWMEQLFNGRYEDAYFEQRAAIGRAHVRVNLPQHYMLTAMNVVRRELLRHIEDLRLADDFPLRVALNKILDLDLAIMLESYRVDLMTQLRQVERERYEERLDESRHLATVGQLAASLAHEIKNPLAGISGALQVIGANLPPDHAHKGVLNEALNQIDRLDAAVKDLLVFARPKAPKRARQSVGALLHRSMMLLREEPAMRTLTMRIEEPAHDVQVALDGAQFQQVIANLLINAAHACGSDGEVICRLLDDDRGVRIEVEDNGRGMPAEVAARAFEPFFTTKAKGTGLGLAICRRIVEAHDGRIEIRSHPGAGTCVSIVVPKEG